MKLIKCLSPVFALLFLATAPLIATVHAQDRVEYSDVDSTHWAAEALSRIGRAGWIEGLHDGTYRGDRKVTRYEAAVTLARILRDFRGSGEAGPGYPDVKPGHWAHDAITFLDRRAFIEGLPDGTFGGDRPLTRYGYAILMNRLLPAGSPDNASTTGDTKGSTIATIAGVTTYFPDVPANHPACAAVNRLTELGLVEGFADGMYHGNRPMTRYELAVALARVGA